MVLMEAICGKPALDITRPTEHLNLARWASICQEMGTFHEIIDPYLNWKVNLDSINKVCELAWKCLEERRINRPPIGYVLCDLEDALHIELASPIQQVSVDCAIENGMKDEKYINKKNLRLELKGKEEGLGHEANLTRKVLEDKGKKEQANKPEFKESVETEVVQTKDKKEDNEVQSKEMEKKEKEATIVDKTEKVNGGTVSPQKSDGLSHAIVLYGSVSPMSEMTLGLKRIGLKRSLTDEDEEKHEAKQRKLFLSDEVNADEV
ncbi:receptor-like kinase LIP2 [Neltuma alba]|uniref:receptor-like kinase LIP2 n=1 Tax=Neltuma alba TaxID=207710 RepID=UPI0010A48501|nr:receptor-like kinase LIP2 [Prosopis alba]